MAFPLEKPIKHEKDDYESDSAEYLSPELEVTVKVEAESVPVIPWEVKTEFSSNEKPVNLGLDFQNSDWVDYEKLIECKRLQCEICNEQFFERYSVLRHNLVHLKLVIEPLKKCPFCPEHFPTENEWLTHIESNHSNELLDEDLDLRTTKTLHQCKICGKIQTYKVWHSHMREVHSMGNYKCSVCNAVFKCARYLRKHVYSIHEKRKYRSYKQMESEEKCTLCPSVLRCKNALKTHMRNCHSEKAQCQLCKSVLKSKTYLHTHMRRVHYDDGTVHKCFCGKIFHSPRYLKVHKKNAHSR